MKKANEQKRTFLGTIGNKVSDFVSKQERAFQKAHLKAYLKGKQYFNYGFTDGITGREPVTHIVKQKFSTNTIQAQ